MEPRDLEHPTSSGETLPCGGLVTQSPGGASRGASQWGDGVQSLPPGATRSDQALAHEAGHRAPRTAHPGAGETARPAGRTRRRSAPAVCSSGAEINQKQDRRLYSLAKIFAETASIHAAATAIMQLEPWDFMAVYYDAIDHFCHGFMRYRPPRSPWIPEQDFELYHGVVEAAYRFHDLMLGALMTLAGEDTTIVIASDHGFHPDRLRPQHLPNEPAGPAEEHRPYGILAMKGPGIKRDELVFGATLLDVTPTLLTLFGLPVGRDMDGKVLVTAFD
ncbi:MAG: hypothetical protein D6704_07480 [Nitrospirae bacterium]|nr:MAG: hypothetical protein D6704_07480 [Nitrospirota bacterium]